MSEHLRSGAQWPSDKHELLLSEDTAESWLLARSLWLAVLSLLHHCLVRLCPLLATPCHDTCSLVSSGGMPVPSLLACIQQWPEIVQHLSIDSLLLLFRLLQCLKERLSWLSPCSDSEPPLNLPFDVKKFLASALHISSESPDALLDRCWSVLRISVWASTSATFAEHCRSKELLDAFVKHGIPQGIGEPHRSSLACHIRVMLPGFHDLYPRTHVCLDLNCKSVHQPEGTSPDKSGTAARKLTRLVPLRCVNFTREFGPIPVVAYSAQCRCMF